ncbi:MAG: bifunctional 4-hydroxy-2-oxoglutarate aldolase/2-dehydro-3-deoxy-phosphogluconate aldolase [Phototrophicaceae bacterium]
MARFHRLAVYTAMLKGGMLPLFYHNNIDVSQNITTALYDGGSRVLEFTNRGDFAIEVFSALVKWASVNHPDLIIGVGSVDDPATAALYLAHGANFVVSPTFDEGVARLCNRRKVAYLPGCSTLNEITQAEEWGVEIVKLFPGNTAGGPEFVKAIRAPRPWTSIMPTGGVNADNLEDWFKAGVVCVGMGSQLVKKEWVDNNNWKAIEDATRQALAQVYAVRPNNGNGNGKH